MNSATSVETVEMKRNKTLTSAQDSL